MGKYAWKAAPWPITRDHRYTNGVSMNGLTGIDAMGSSFGKVTVYTVARSRTARTVPEEIFM